MRYFIFYPPTKSTRSIDVGENICVEEILQLAQNEFGLQVNSRGRSEASIVLSYNGFDLKPKWSLADLNIPSGAIIRCIFKEKKAPNLYIHCEFNKQVLKLFDSAIKIDSPISLIRKKISDRIGLPLSTFCLETYYGKKRLFDQMVLMNYDVKIHDHLSLKVWKGYEKLISSCIRGYADHYSHDDLTRYYQIQVALHIAAFYGKIQIEKSLRQSNVFCIHQGHMELASSVMQHGARSDRPVGEHPSRQWSFEAITNTLPEALKCPIHIAVERGHVKMVDLFVRHSILCTQIRDPTTDYLPYRLALSCSVKAKTKEDKQCFNEIYFYLHDKQYNLKIPLNANGDYVTSLLTSTTGASAIHHASANHFDVSLPFYCRIISWYERARERVWKKFGGHFYTMNQTKRIYPRKGLLGYKVLIDGYNNTFEVPTEQHRTVRSGGTPRSDQYVGYNDEERRKIHQMKIFMKQFALDERQRAKQIAATNLQQSRRPPLTLPPILTGEDKHSITTTPQMLEGISSSSEFSNSQIVSSLTASDLKVLKSNVDIQTPSIDKLLNTELIHPIQTYLDNHSSKEKSKQKSKLRQTVPINDDRNTVPIISSSVSNIQTPHSTVRNNIETLADPKEQTFEPVMSSTDAYLFASSRLALETKQHDAVKKRDLFAKIEERLKETRKVSIINTVIPRSDSISFDRQSEINVDTHMPLPEHPAAVRNGPIKSHIDLKIRKSTVQTYERYSSATSRSTAIKCLEEASYFKRKSWIKQVEISKEMVKHQVQRRMRRADNKTPIKSSLEPLRANHTTTPYKSNTLKAN